MNKYTDQSKHILQFSCEEANRLHSDVLRPEHLLLGILRDDTNQAVTTLKQQGVDVEWLREGLENIVTNVAYDSTRINRSSALEGASLSSSTPLAIEFDRALKFAQLEARMLRSTDIAPEHMMLALLKDEESPISQLLKSSEVDYKVFHHAISRISDSSTGTFGTGCDESMNASGEQDNEPICLHESDDIPEEDDNDEQLEGSYSQASAQRSGRPTATQTSDGGSTPTLDRFGFDLTQAARNGELDPVVGRATEIERLTQVLSRRKKNNPVLLGEPGVGKTAIVEGLAQLIADKKVSFLLRDKRLISLDMAGMVAGTKYRGQFEERLKGVMRELKQNPDIILYIDEIHTMVGAGGAEGSMDAANILKPALSRGEIQCIGATTLNEYRKSIEKDGALERRFQKILVEPATADDTLAILHNLRDRYEKHHCVRFTDDALQACVTLADRYITDRNFPDKAIDALDEAGARMHLVSASEPSSFDDLENQLALVKRQKDEAILKQHYELAATYRDSQRQLEQQLKEAREKWNNDQLSDRPIVDADRIADVVAQMTGIPVQKVASTEGQKLRRLKDTLHSHVVGQSAAIDKVVRAIQRNRLGLKDPKKPIGTFLFLGPTGVGKTYLAKKIADELFATKDSLIRIDMSEFMEKYSTSRLIGAAPGYVGYDEGGQLTERVRRHPYSVVLFDEIEKADKEVFNLMLQLFDEGHLTDAQGRKVDFKNCIIILTSNVGSRQLGEFGTGIGFQQHTAEEQNAAAEAVIQKELKKTFAPEFLNRIDDIIHFSQLQPTDIRQIVDIELSHVLPRIEEQGYTISLTPAVREFLASKGYDRKFGARPLKRAIQTYIEDVVCDGLLDDHEAPVSAISIDMVDGEPKATFS